LNQSYLANINYNKIKVIHFLSHSKINDTQIETKSFDTQSKNNEKSNQISSIYDDKKACESYSIISNHSKLMAIVIGRSKNKSM